MNGSKNMSLKDVLKNFIQVYGSRFSRLAFSERTLSSDVVKFIYIKMYDSFKWLFEGREMAQMRSMIPEGSTVLDIGANTGWTAAHFAKAVGQNGKVVAFEPDPVARSIGRYRTRNVGNIIWMPFALGSADGSAVFYQNLSNRADNRMVFDPEMMASVKKIEVNTRSLSSVWHEMPDLFKNVSLIKMDVQGYEKFVVLGMSEWMSSLTNKPKMTFEWWPYGLAKTGTDPLSFLDELSELGYFVPAEFKTTVDKKSEKDWYESAVVAPKI